MPMSRRVVTRARSSTPKPYIPARFAHRMLPATQHATAAFKTDKPNVPMTTRFILRGRAENDSAALFAMFLQPLCRRGAFREFISAEDLKAWFHSQGTGNVELVVAANDTAIALGGLFFGTGCQAHVGTVCLFVHDDYHRLGIGRRLMSAIVTAADRTAHLRRMQLFVSCDNTNAIALYRRFGFSVEGRHECSIQRGDRYVDVYTMAKTRKDAEQM